VTARPDPLIHPIIRLSICGLLAVLSKQCRVLEDAG
jgi:hypothetical protein